MTAIAVLDELIVLILSVVEQEKGEQADQNTDERAENSEPEREVSVLATDGLVLVPERFCESCHEIHPGIVRTARKRTLPLCIRS